MESAVWLVTGAQASGKSTIADLLARSIARGVHVPGGAFYRWTVSGWTHFDGADGAEARRLLDLRYELSAATAHRYADAGFTAIVQDNIYGADVAKWLEYVDWSPCISRVISRAIVLFPLPGCPPSWTSQTP